MLSKRKIIIALNVTIAFVTAAVITLIEIILASIIIGLDLARVHTILMLICLALIIWVSLFHIFRQHSNIIENLILDDSI